MKKVFVVISTLFLVILFFKFGITAGAKVIEPLAPGIDFPDLDLVENMGDMANYVVLQDYDDTTSWGNSVSLSTNFYEATFSTGNDNDYYTYTPAHTRSFYVLISSSDDVKIFIYKGNNQLLVSSYYNSKEKTYNSFINNLVTVDKNETVYIKVVPRYFDGMFYDIKIVDNPNISTKSSHKTLNNVTSYYGGTGTIRYWPDNNYYFYYGTSHTFFDIFLEALSIWNNVGCGNYLEYWPNYSSDAINLFSNTTTYVNSFPIDNYVYCGNNMCICKTWFNDQYFSGNGLFAVRSLTISNNYDSDSYVQNLIFDYAISHDISYYEAAYKYVLNYMVQGIGFTLGLLPSTCQKNVMYPGNYFYEGLGDGDIASLLDIR